MPRYPKQPPSIKLPPEQPGRALVEGITVPSRPNTENRHKNSLFQTTLRQVGITGQSNQLRQHPTDKNGGSQERKLNHPFPFHQSPTHDSEAYQNK
jgi:hypothetical protein